MSAVVLAVLLAVSPVSAATDTHREWRFRVLVDGRPVGTHVYDVDARSGGDDVHSKADFDVRVLLYHAYHYSHEAREQWQGNCLQSLDSHTDDNGILQAVDGTREGAQFAVTATGGNAQLPACVMSFAYWNPAILAQKKLLDGQTGEYLDVRVETLGAETIPVRGIPTVVQRYALDTAKFRIDLWYTADGRWVQLESRTDSGRLVRYLIQ